jgi:hypothetical protein
MHIENGHHEYVSIKSISLQVEKPDVYISVMEL